MPTQASNCRLRKGRFSQPGQIYVLISVVKQRRVVFKDWHIGRLLVNQFREAENAGLVASLAWVVMPDHFHWLIQLQQGSLAELMCRVKSRSSKAINGHGAIWQRGYHDRAVRCEDDLKMIARYIVMNPIRADLVQKVGDYPLWDAIWI